MKNKSAIYIVSNYQSYADKKLKKIQEENDALGKTNIIYYNGDAIVKNLMIQDGINAKATKAWMHGKGESNESQSYYQRMMAEIIWSAHLVQKDLNIAGIYLTGSFLVHDDNDKTIHNSLKEIGYDPNMLLEEIPWTEIIKSTIKNDENLIEICEHWEAFNNQFLFKTKTSGNSKAIVIVFDGSIFEPKDRFNYYEGTFNDVVASMLKTFIANDYRIIFLCDRPSKEVDTISFIQQNLGIPEEKEMDRFWYIFNSGLKKSIFQLREEIYFHRLKHFDIEYVFETDPNGLIFWKRIGIPTMFFGNPWKLSLGE